MKIEKIELESPALANCYLLTDETTNKAVIIDPGYFGNCLKNAVDNSGAEIEKIILTHGHFDHIVGVFGLKEYTGAKVYIHKNDEDCLFDEKKSLNGLFPGTAEQTPMRADNVFEDGDKITFGNCSLTVLHTPGHTPGSVCLIDYNGRNIISGDTLFKLTVGRTDFDGGNDEEMKASIKKLLALEGDFDVYPGHNISTTLDEERKRNIYVRRMMRKKQ